MFNSRSQHMSSTSGAETILHSSSTRNLAFKTPARSLKHGRAVHDENAIYGHPRTAGLTGRKGINIVSFDSPATGTSFKSPSKTEKILRTTSKSTVLSSKTPFHKAQFPATPAPTSLKPLKSFAIFNDDASDALSARRISSTRKKLRLPRSASKSFETPETVGNHWDVSDVSIEASMIEEVNETSEDSDDVEYGPPTAIDPKYDPAFEMPDYKEVGTTLMRLFRRNTIPEEYDPVAEYDNTELLAELGDLKWEERIELPKILVEDIFPFMIRSEPLVRENRPQVGNTRPNQMASFSKQMAPGQLMQSLKPKAPGSIRPASSVGKLSSLSNPLPNNTVSKPMNRPISHSRIPSLTTTVARPGNLTRSHTRTTSVSHLQATSLSHPKAVTTSHLRSTSLSKPLSLGTKIQGVRLIHSKFPEDTVQALFADTGDEVLGEDFLFKV